jgi:hypothetical protein
MIAQQKICGLDKLFIFQRTLHGVLMCVDEITLAAMPMLTLQLQS